MNDYSEIEYIYDGYNIITENDFPDESDEMLYEEEMKESW